VAAIKPLQGFLLILLYVLFLVTVDMLVGLYELWFINPTAVKHGCQRYQKFDQKSSPENRYPL
jgi:hypothetical protein